MAIAEIRTSSVGSLNWVDSETKQNFRKLLLTTKVQEIVTGYHNLKELIEKPLNPLEKARVTGTIEIQRLYLSMLGQTDAIERKATSLQPIKIIGDKEINIFGRLYKNARRYVTGDFSSKSPEEYTPEDVRMETRMNVLTLILSDLDQDEYRKSIDIDVMFENMRKTDPGQLH